ncbi:hypothetical protein MHBO_002203 [Bonamia ostreae]|uniref:Uncharacterized protein n=1 Tax=Bonamia ostreae TaxID=126728 RepID=A0ABV2ALJ0_9EUKA
MDTRILTRIDIIQQINCSMNPFGKYLLKTKIIGYLNITANLALMTGVAAGFGYFATKITVHNTNRKSVIKAKSESEMEYTIKRNQFLAQKQKEIQREVYLRKKREERAKIN